LTQKRGFICWAVTAMLLAAAACARRQQDPARPIVEAAEKAGAGDLSNASVQAMEQWLGKHRDVSAQIENVCKPVRQHATAQWSTSTEGRLCNAAHDLAFFRSAPVTGDGKGFRPGLH
jgi:hypothetical protein